MIEESIISIHTPHNYQVSLFEKGWEIVHELASCVHRVQCNVIDMLNISWVSSGGLDAHIIPIGCSCKWWDIVSSLIFVTEAGGSVSTLRNNPVTEANFSTEGVLASNGTLHTELLERINTKDMS
jgi:fructose-1,6-bisphosphatase/inositol monophosphatase family enzyme